MTVSPDRTVKKYALFGQPVKKVNKMVVAGVCTSRVLPHPMRRRLA